MRSTETLSDGSVHSVLRGRGGATTSLKGEEAERLAPQPTFLESSFPFREISLQLAAVIDELGIPSTASTDGGHGAHLALRGLLIASHLDADATTDDFWRLFASAERPLAGQRVLGSVRGRWLHPGRGRAPLAHTWWAAT
jgi:hypothetical protein